MRLEGAHPAAFDRRLERDQSAPIAVAVSGGADSLLALIETAAWAKTHGRPILALSVDHGLQANSAVWTAKAGEAARRLDCDFQALAWAGPKPDQGLPAAARAARHRLLADAARDAGACVIVIGHTGDDRLENAALTQGDLVEWGPSPVWPEGRGLALLRPLLGQRRGAIRQRLAALGWSWVDDPANNDLAHPRVRARRQISADDPLPPPAADGSLPGAERVRFEDESIVLPRSACSLRLIAIASVCMGGSETLPRREPVRLLAARVAKGEAFTATLAGARIIVGKTVTFVREAGEISRGGLAPITAPGIWDGRYAIGGEGEVRAVSGLAKRLPEEQRQRLTTLPAAVRPGLPVIVQHGLVTCPILTGTDLAPTSETPVERLWPGRFLTACGLYAHESDLRQRLR